MASTMSHIWIGKDEFKRATYLTYFFFLELGFQSDFLETELFTLLYGSKDIERALQIMKKSGWKFKNKESNLSVWVWKKPRRITATLHCISPHIFVFRIGGFCWGYDLQSEYIPPRIVSEREWKEIETEARHLRDKHDRVDRNG